VLVCLGATAAQALLGGQFRVTKERGRSDDRETEFAALVDDLRVVAKLI
jgi:hypothetical protein